MTRKYGRVRTLIVAAAGAGALLAAPTDPAYAINPCLGDNPPPSCNPPTPTTYSVDGPHLTAMESLPQFHGNATLTTTMWVRKLYSRATNQQIAEYFVAEHHVANALLFAPTTITSDEKVFYNRSLIQAYTNSATITVTAVLLDAGNSTQDQLTQTRISIGAGSNVCGFQVTLLGIS